MKKLKVVTIVGTRPEIIRLSRLIPKLDEFTDHVFVHTGQNSNPRLNDIFFEDLELRKPDYYLNVDTSSMGTVMGDTIKKSEEVFLKEKPDAVMILGDTNSAIAAIVAERMHIPVYHMEAGNRSFDNNVPEELNRKMVDHISSFNLPYNSYSYQNLIYEGIHPKTLLKTGSPIPEVLSHYRNRIESSRILENLNLQNNSYFLVSLHRQENVDHPNRLNRIINSLVHLHRSWGLPVIVSTHPRTRNKLNTKIEQHSSDLTFLEPFGYLDYNKLQLNARCVISDSGTITEESSLLGFPAVILRDSTERPEGLEAGSITICGIEDDLIRAVNFALTDRVKNLPEGYEQIDFSNTVLNFLLSTCRLSTVWKGLIFEPKAID